ncbi:hypothetical protein [Dyadobacter sp. 32]|uniref:hypothetical protein n=1 Tax=Dyadobacter sp. 32 TaxID=538966 RepID=UPI0011ED8725
MLRNFCLLLLTIFFICKSTDVLSILLAKDKIVAVCNSGDCESEKSEIEKVTDDQQIYHHFVNISQHPSSAILRVAFSYSVPSENDILENLFSPPPELI